VARQQGRKGDTTIQGRRGSNHMLHYLVTGRTASRLDTAVAATVLAKSPGGHMQIVDEGGEARLSDHPRVATGACHFPFRTNNGDVFSAPNCRYDVSR
jgi:hypothetical protein